jgi:hypothetical protein
VNLVHIDELDAIEMPEGFAWRPVRRRFGIRAFGTNAYTPGSGLGSGAIAVAISAIPSGAMSRRVWTIVASATGFPLGLCTSRTATVATLLDLMSVLTGSNA